MTEESRIAALEMRVKALEADQFVMARRVNALNETVDVLVRELGELAARTRKAY